MRPGSPPLRPRQASIPPETCRPATLSAAGSPAAQAWHAVWLQAAGSRLFPAGREAQIREWNAACDDVMSYGRRRLALRMQEDAVSAWLLGFLESEF